MHTFSFLLYFWSAPKISSYPLSLFHCCSRLLSSSLMLVTFTKSPPPSSPHFFSSWKERRSRCFTILPSKQTDGFQTRLFQWDVWVFRVSQFWHLTKTLRIFISCRLILEYCVCRIQRKVAQTVVIRTIWVSILARNVVFVRISRVNCPPNGSVWIWPVWIWAGQFRSLRSTRSNKPQPKPYYLHPLTI